MPDQAPLETSLGRAVRARAHGLTSAAVLVGLTVAAYAKFLGTGFAATDSLPLIETSRLGSLADVGLQFTRPVMAGTRFALGEVVYRPLVSVTFGVDYALWGLNAVGFHATNLGLHLVGVLGVWFLLSGLGLRNWSALAGAALFALHPLVVASVPVIARRDSVLPVTAFVLGAGLLIRAERARGSRQVWLASGSVVLVGIALLSKESAFAALMTLPILLVSARLARGGDPRGVPRQAVLLVPLVVLAVGIFVVRLRVLGGLGQAQDSNLLAVDWDKYSQILGAFTRELAWTFAGLAASTREIWPRLAGLSLLGLAISLPWLPRRHALLATAGVIWVAMFAVFCMVLKIATIAWLAYFALVGVALVFGAGLEGAIVRLGEVRLGRFRHARRAAALALLGALVVYGASALYASPMVRAYDQWQIAGDVTENFSQALGTCVARSPAATQVRLNGLPSSFEDGRVETNLMGVTLLEDWTVDAVLRLLFPRRDLTVHVSSWGTLRAGADTLRFSCSTPDPQTVELTTSY